MQNAPWALHSTLQSINSARHLLTMNIAGYSAIFFCIGDALYRRIFRRWRGRGTDSLCLGGLKRDTPEDSSFGQRVWEVFSWLDSSARLKRGGENRSDRNSLWTTNLPRLLVVAQHCYHRDVTFLSSLKLFFFASLSKPKDRNEKNMVSLSRW